MGDDTRVARFSTPADDAECRRLHKLHGSTYYYATRFFPPTVRRRVHALYGYVRTADEWVDNPGLMTVKQRAAKLRDFRAQLLLGVDGVAPGYAALRAFVDTMREVSMEVHEPLIFLDAMEMDLDRTRYETYEDLRDYMRGSAVAIGLMMCDMVGAKRDETIDRAATALSEAMQLTNFLRDIGEDVARGRIYLPQSELKEFEVDESDLVQGIVSDAFIRLMQFQIGRARNLYAIADTGFDVLPSFARRPIRLARILYSRILDRIEERGYDVFSGRARTTRWEKLRVATLLMIGLGSRA